MNYELKSPIPPSDVASRIPTSKGEALEGEIIELLRQFYSVRVRRWRSQAPFIQTFETSQEKMLGWSYLHAFQLLRYLEEYTAHERALSKSGSAPLIRSSELLPICVYPRNQFNEFVYHISTIEMLNDKIHSILDGTMISINAMSGQKAEVKGFLLASLYKYLDWDYKPEVARPGFHTFLGNQLNMRSTEIDSLFASTLEAYNVDLLREVANERRRVYLDKYNNFDADSFNLQVFYDHFTDDFFSKDLVFFKNIESRNILFPHVDRYVIKSPWLEIEIKGQGFLYHFDRRNQNIQTFLKPETVAYIYASVGTTNEFDELVFKTENVGFRARIPGELSLDNGVLQIKLQPQQRYNIEAEYWEKIEELNRRLVSRGVPEHWLADNMNHEQFRIYHSVVRHFTNMPEHRVGRGERDQDWYMRHFGVEERVRRGANFRRVHRDALLAAEQRHGIHYELLMAIMAIESDYANPRWRGTFYTFPTLVSQFLLLPRRERFAVNELVALYEFTQKTNKDVYHFIGSFAGAAGWGQFIPSSMLNFFINANDNFYEVDIFCIDDTLHSISNYLFHHGLNRQNIRNRQTLFRVIRTYNHSDAYVRAVLFIYDELRKQR